MASSNRSRRSKASVTERRRRNTLHLVWSGVERGCDGSDEAIPTRGLFPKALSADRRQGIELRASFVVVSPRCGAEQPLMCEPVQRRIQRALRNLQSVLGNLGDAQ